MIESRTLKSITAQQRERALKQVMGAIREAGREMESAVDKAGAEIEPGSIHGTLIELLRGAPELSDEIERAPGRLVAYAAVLAVEQRHDAGIELRSRLNDLLENEAGEVRSDGQ